MTGVAGFLVLSMLAYPALRPMERMLFQSVRGDPDRRGSADHRHEPIVEDGQTRLVVARLVFPRPVRRALAAAGIRVALFQSLVWQAKRQPERQIQEVRKAAGYWMQSGLTTTPLIWYEGTRVLSRRSGEGLALFRAGGTTISLAFTGHQRSRDLLTSSWASATVQ